MSNTQNHKSGHQSRILALDYGSVHTGAAISDPTGTIVRPLKDIYNAASSGGLKRIKELVECEGADSIIVGMPVSLSGERGYQAKETERFILLLKEKCSVPVYSWDERFTSKIAAEKGRGADASSHSLAACCLLEDYLRSQEFQQRSQK